MVNNMFRNGLVLGIIVLFVGAGVVPSIGQLSSKDNCVSSIIDYPSWLWTSQACGSERDVGWSCCGDTEGNIYITGHFEKNITFGTHNLISVEDEDLFVAKLDPEGNWLWAVHGRGRDTDISYDICISSDGYLYITGFFSYNITFGSIQLESNDTYDVFVAKLDQEGNWLWAVHEGENHHSAEYGYGIATDMDNYIYLTGSFTGTTTFGNDTISAEGQGDIFVAKLDSEGNWLWASHAGGIDWDSGKSICVDDNGCSYVTGYFYDKASFDEFNLTGYGESDIFIAKLDSSGDWVWVNQAGGADYDSHFRGGIDFDSNGYIFVFGDFAFNATFGPFNLTNDWKSDLFVAKLDTNGSWIFVIQSKGWMQGYDLCIDTYGYISIIGKFIQTVTFGDIDLYSRGLGDVFISEIDAEGNWRWAIQGGGTGDDFGRGIFVDNYRNLFVTGEFKENATFGSINLTSCGNSDIFVGKIENENLPPITPTIDGPARGKAGVEYNYTFKTIDPEGDYVYFWIEWGDGDIWEWIGTIPPSYEITLPHTWDEKGTFTISAKAKDEHGAESGWGTLEVTMPKNKPFIFNFPLLYWLFERFPHTFPILRNMLGL